MKGKTVMLSYLIVILLICNMTRCSSKDDEEEEEDDEEEEDTKLKKKPKPLGVIITNATNNVSMNETNNISMNATTAILSANITMKLYGNASVIPPSNATTKITVNATGLMPTNFSMTAPTNGTFKISTNATTKLNSTKALIKNITIVANNATIENQVKNNYTLITLIISGKNASILQNTSRSSQSSQSVSVTNAKTSVKYPQQNDKSESTTPKNSVLMTHKGQLTTSKTNVQQPTTARIAPTGSAGTLLQKTQATILTATPKMTITNKYSQITSILKTTDISYNKYETTHKTARQRKNMNMTCERPQCKSKKCNFEGDIAVDNWHAGVWQNTCDRSYWFSNIKKTWAQAREFCCSLKLEIISIEDRKEQLCLHSFLHMYKFGSTPYWSSGTDEGCEGTFWWCATDLPVDIELKWMRGQPDNYNGENCVTAQFIQSLINRDDEVVLNDKSCDSEELFICEAGANPTSILGTSFMKSTTVPGLERTVESSYKCIKPKCPKILCVKNDSLEIDEERLEYPLRASLKIICDKKYLFVKVKKSWKEARETCCALGMELLAIDDKLEQACLSILLRGEKLGTNVYWSSGTDLECEGKYWWCSGGESEVFREVIWEKRQSDVNYDDKELNCLTLEYTNSLNRLERHMGLNDLPCQSKQFFICEDIDILERKTTSNDKTTAQPEAGITDIKQQVKECKSRACLKALATQQEPNVTPLPSTTKTVPKSKECKPLCPSIPCNTSGSVSGDNTISLPSGSWQTLCGIKYWISKMKKSWIDAYKTCCDLNMRLLTIENIEKEICLRKTLIGNFLINGPFWTSGSVSTCEKSFCWCTIDQPFFSDITWQQGNPSNNNNNEKCVELIVGHSLSPKDQFMYINDNDCEVKLKFMCEKIALATETPAVITIHDKVIVTETTSVIPPVVQQESRSLYTQLQYANTNSNCTRPQCLLNKCVKNNSYVDENKADDNIKGVSWKYACNSRYLFVNTEKIKKTWTQAQEYCCSRNMQLISIESPKKQKCMESFIMSIEFGTTTFWTSGTDVDCEGKYWWCNRDVPFFTGIRWEAGNPDNRGNEEHCILLVYQFNPLKKIQSSSLNDRRCSHQMGFVCEDISSEISTYVTKPPKIVTKCKKDQCKTVINVEKDKLTNTTKNETQSNKPTCTQPQCLKYKCQPDSRVVGTKNYMNASSKIGYWKTLCNKQYLLSHETKELTWVNANSACCALNMRLLSLRSYYHEECFLPIHNEFYKVEGYYMFWTAGSDHNCEGRYYWCNNQTPFSKNLTWIYGKPKKNAKANCITLDYKSSHNKEQRLFGLRDAECKSTNRFICEKIDTINLSQENEQISTLDTSVEKLQPQTEDSKDVTDTCTRAVCPNVVCKKNMSMFTSGGKRIINPKIATWKVTCNTKYLFGVGLKQKYKMTWTEAQEYCCSLNMRLLTIETREKQECFAKFSDPLFFTLFSRFWTSGSDQGCESKFSWCTNNQPISTALKWTDGNPDNYKGNENCLSLDFVSVPSTKELRATLNDRTCDKEMNFICEEMSNLTIMDNAMRTMKSVQDTTPTYGYSKTSACVGPNCPMIFVKRNTSYSVVKINDTFVSSVPTITYNVTTINYATVPTSLCSKPVCSQHLIKCSSLEETKTINFTTNETLIGTYSILVMHTICGKRYLFSLNKTNYVNANKDCCLFGMRLVNIETVQEFQCIDKYYKDNFKRSDVFYTGGTNSKCPHVWWWCHVDVPLYPEASWRPGEPDYSDESDNTIAIKLTLEGEKSGYKDENNNITNNLRFLCESDDAPSPEILTRTTQSVEQTTTRSNFETLPATKGPQNTTIADFNVTKETTKSCKSVCANQICPIKVTQTGVTEENSVVPTTFGITKNICNKRFVFSRKARNYIDANEACCNFNLRLVTFTTQEDMTCVQEFYKSNFLENSNFWTGGRNCGDNLVWCESRVARESTLRISKNPEEVKDCVSITLTAEGEETLQNGLAYQTCNLNLRFICVA